MKNITVTMDEETARWARIEAARRGISVSRMLGEILENQMFADTNYETASNRYRARTARLLKAAGQRYPDRDALHERRSR
ncbi:MAG: hypothetical protein RQ847_12595 [Wenzhouxiangellaceae bacterium]|nr:hypothetical protein [Wenzhouxiangellaceae bacterium]